MKRIFQTASTKKHSRKFRQKPPFIGCALFFLHFMPLCMAQDNANYAQVRYRIYEIERYTIDSLRDYTSAQQTLYNLLSHYEYPFLDAYELAFHNLFCNLRGSWTTHQDEIQCYLKKIAPFYAYSTLNTWLVKWTRRDLSPPSSKRYKDLRIYPGFSLYCWGCADKSTKTQMRKQIRKYRDIQPKNDSLAKELISMEKKDQKARNIKDFYKANAAIIAIDSINCIKLDRLIARYHKIPGIREVGNEARNAIELVMTHMEYDWILEKMPYIEKGILSGDLDPERMAWIVDYSFHQKQLAGQDRDAHGVNGPFGSLKTNLKEFLPVEDLEKTNERRKAWGLPPLEYYRIQNNP